MTWHSNVEGTRPSLISDIEMPSLIPAVGRFGFTRGHYEGNNASRTTQACGEDQTVTGT